MALDRNAGQALKFFFACALISFSGAVITLAAYIQHIMTCFKHEAIGLLILGMIVFPIGVLHGFGIWLGAFAH